VLDDVAPNAEAFMNQLSQLSDLVDGEWEQIVRKSAFDLYSRIAKRTPFKTGRARGGWGITTSEVESSNEPGRMDLDFHIEDDTIIIYNNVEYISYLEDGWSRQAPEGMVALSLAEFTAHFKSQITQTNLGKMGGFVIE